MTIYIYILNDFYNFKKFIFQLKIISLRLYFFNIN